MAQIITIAAAAEQFKSEIYDTIVAQFGAEDDCAMSEAWNDYTDYLCKNGQLNDLQYHHCPVFDDAKNMCDDWTEELEFLLTELGITMSVTESLVPREGWPTGSTHWDVAIYRHGKQHVKTQYSMGSMFSGTPEIAQVFYSLLCDVSDYLDDGFEDWAEMLGYDSDSRKAEKIYNACKVISEQLNTMLSKAEIADLREVSEEM